VPTVAGMLAGASGGGLALWESALITAAAAVALLALVAVVHHAVVSHRHRSVARGV